MKTRMTAMNRTFALVSALGLAAVGAVQPASAGGGLPPADIYLGGLLHSPLGSVVLTQTGERKLQACCLGSSGEDGVEVRYNSIAGGSVTMDPGPLPAGSSLRTRYKGWDGTIKGRCEISRNIADEFEMEIDFSGMGCDAVRVMVVDDDGTVLSDETSPGDQRIINLNGVGVIGIGPCPGGGFPQWYESFKLIEPYWNGFQWVWFEITWVYGCPGTSWSHQRQVRAYAMFDAFPTTFGMESVLITGTGDGSTLLEVSDAGLVFQDVAVHGTGGTYLSEACDSPIGCTPSTVSLVCDNLGSSGQDGVSIDLTALAGDSLGTGGGGGGGGGGGAGGVAMEMKACCRGHVTILKLHDDAGGVQSVTRSPLPGGGIDDEELDADFSAIGAIGYTLELFDVDNNPIGPVGGTDIISGGPRPYWTNRCPIGSTEVWQNQGTPSNPVWVFTGCLGPSYDFTLPGGIVVPGVASFRVTALGASSGYSTRKRAEVLRSAGAQIEITGITLTPAPCDGDSDGDGVVDFDDITATLAAWGSDYSPLTGAGDANHDSVVDFDDITGVLANWGSTCP